MTKSNKEPRSIRLLTALLLLATFAAGIAAGVGLYRWIAGGSESPPPPMLAPLPLDEVGLTQEQWDKIRDIVDTHRPELESILRETFPAVKAINEKIEEKVREVLTDEQRARLDAAKAKFGRRDRGGPPGGPGSRGPMPHGKPQGGFEKGPRRGPPPGFGPGPDAAPPTDEMPSKAK